MLKKNSVDVHIDKNALVDQGDGVINFPNGQVIVDDTEMWNGYKYDIESLDISQYGQQLTADHVDSLTTLIGEVSKPYKQGAKVLIDSIRFAVKESAAGRLAYDLTRGGYLKSFSVETIGPWPGEDDKTYHEAALVGLSAVVVGNNKSARINQFVLNSIAQSKQAGLDTTKLEEAFPSEPSEPQPPKEADKPENQIKQETEDMKFHTVKNNRDFAVPVKYKNAAGEDVETELAPKASIDVADDQKDAVEKQLNDAKAPEADVNALVAKAVAAARKEDADALEKVQKQLNEAKGTGTDAPDVDKMVKEAIAEARKEDATALKDMQDQLATYKEAFDKDAKEPELRAAKPGETPTILTKSGLAAMSDNERTKLHLNAVAGSVIGRSLSSMQTLETVNQFNLERLKEAGKVENTVTLTDFGNFVLGPENIPEPTKKLSNYRPLLDKFTFQETNALQTSWIEQNGEIEMQDVDMEDHGDNADLKPLSEYDTTSHTAWLKEFAAVTPVDASAIRFSAADIMQNINDNYLNAYDKALARSVIGRLEKAVESNGQTTSFDYHTSPVEALLSLLSAYETIAEFVPDAPALMTEGTYLQLLGFQMRAGVGTDSAWAQVFTKADQPLFFGRPYIIVPSKLMPRVNSSETKSWTFEGVSVTVNTAIFFADPNQFMGRVSGGLSYQVSSEAAYEVSGVVKSAFQRDKLVFRGYGYRKSAIKDTTSVAGVLAPGVS